MTIPEAEILVGIAALGLTVTGFSGLISVLGRRSAGHWTEAERFQLGQLITLSLAVTFASFVPLLVGMLLDGQKALTTATGLVALFHLLILVQGVTKNYRYGRLAAVMPVGITLFMVVGGFCLIAAGFMSSFGMLGGAAFLLVSNLLWQLMVAIVHFVYLLMGADSPE